MYFARYFVTYYDGSKELAHETEEDLSLEEITNGRLRELLGCEYCAEGCEIHIHKWDEMEPDFQVRNLPLVQKVIIADTTIYRPLVHRPSGMVESARLDLLIITLTKLIQQARRDKDTEALLVMEEELGRQQKRRKELFL